MTLINFAEFDQQMNEKGWAIFDRVVPSDSVARMRDDIHKAYDICRSFQEKNGVSDMTENTVHHLIGIPQVAESFLEFLEKLPITEYIERHFGGNFILNSFGGAINTAYSRSYAHNIHRDIRSYSGDVPLILNTLIMLDDFTAENGATFLMSGSHKKAQKPTKEEFYAVAKQAIGQAGSILMFNSNVWHAGGANNTDKPRRSVTPMYSKPFLKQQYDYPRALGYDQGDKFSAHLRQIIGYNSRIPATLDEWYQPPEKRMYRPGQG
jgi:hypothetical protein